MMFKNKTGLGTLFLIFGILVLLNLLSLKIFKRIDLTSGKVFSLSEASKRIVRNLDDKLLVKMFFTKDLPPPHNANIRYVKDQLEEYRSYSGGNMELELINPKDEEKEMEAQRYRIPPLQMNVLQNDKLEIKKVYMGLAFLYEDKFEAIPVVHTISGLEYEITSIIKKLTSEKISTIGFITGHGEPTTLEGLTYLNQKLEKEYRVRQINLQELGEVPRDIDGLVIIGPKKPFSDWEKYVLDQFLMRGGKLGLFLDKFDVNLQEGMAQPLSLGLDDFLKNYGIKINDDLVVDLKCSQLRVQQSRGLFAITNLVNYPYFPLSTNFDKKNVIVKGLETVEFPFVSSIDSALTKEKNLNFTPIVLSSDKSGSLRFPFDITPFKKFSSEDFDKKNLILAGIISGRFQSFFVDKPKPEPPEKISSDTLFLSESPENRLVVVGDADLIQDGKIGSKDNLIFFMNIIDWLSQDETLIAIRSKEVTSRPLKKISDGKKKALKYGNILGIPILVVLFGVFRWRIRKQAKKRAL